MPKKMLFIFNPHAGKSQIRPKLMDIINCFAQAEYEIQIYATQKQEDAITAAASYGGGVDLVVCSGGDGTLNEVCCGLMQLPKRPPLGYIPAGTCNDFAYTHKLSKNMVEAARTAIGGTPEEVDLGCMNGRYFTYVAGFGAFTDVSYKTPQEIKAVLGHPAYILEAMNSLGDLTPYRMRVETEEEVLEDEFLVGLISNSVRVAGLKGLYGNTVELDDGYHEVLLVRNPKNLVVLQETLMDLLQHGKDSPHIWRKKVRKIHFSSEEPVDWVVDGEFGGSLTSVTVENVQKAIRVMKKSVKKI